MSLLQNSNAISAGGYDINNSLRFRSSASARLSRTPSSAGNRKTFTWSAWVKRGNYSTGNGQKLISAYNANTDSGWFDFRFHGDNTLMMVTYNWTFYTNAVFRDNSAWYHVVLAVDTTQATGSNRVKIYVNGVQQTLSGSTATQNTDLAWNNTIAQYIGMHAYNSSEFFDGYMAEMHHVDGQQLTPSSFGETDAVTGVWKPKAYTGTYGTNGFYLPFTTPTTSAYAGLFNGSSHSLSVASNSVFGYGTSDFTMEGWFLFSDLSTRTLMSNLTVGGSVAPHIYYNTSAGITYYTNSADRINGGALATNKWYHIALCRSGSSTRLFVNGSQVGSTYTDSNNYGTSNPFIIADYGSPVSGVSQFYGYISNVRVVKGTALYTSNFVPPVTSLTNISGTSILTLQNSTIIDNSSNSLSITNNGSTATYAGNIIFNANITTDASGNKNHWVSNNINYSFYGTTYDAMTDSPTLTSATVANYPTLNPLATNTGTFSNGNLQYTGPTNWYHTKSTIEIPSTGKFYAEATLLGTAANNAQGGAYAFFGVCPTDRAVAGASDGNNLIITDTGWYYNFVAYPSGTNSGSSFSTGDVIGLAIDRTNNTYTFYKNNTSIATGTINYTSGNPLVFCYGSYNGSYGVMAINFGQRPFAYTPPTGYKALNTYNLPDSTIKKGNNYMDAVLYTGNGISGRAVNTTTGFRPDFAWAKSRDVAGSSHILIDSNRGNNKYLISESTAAEGTASDLTFTSTGVTWNNGVSLNGNGYSYVNWFWQAGQGSTSSNTSGSITSTVSVNTTAGFSVCTFTTPSASHSNFTFGHGLGVAPKMVIVKSRSAATDWVVYHAGMGATKGMYLNQTLGAQTSTGFWQDTTPSSTLVYIGTGFAGSSETAVAYCWAEISGFSKFGSYVGNGSTDGTFIYLGFRPKYLMVKSTSGNAWEILDTSRNTYNAITSYLEANNSNAEATYTFGDSLSNGFKFRDVGASLNASGTTYIYAAFAENPFKNANAR